MGAKVLIVFSILAVSVFSARAGDTIVRLETVATGLSSPLYVTHAGDGSSRLFIVEQAGRIRILKAGQLLTTPFLNIVSRVESGGEKGLLGLAFHPSFETNRRFFVNYTRRVSGALRTVIAEYRASEFNPDVADASETVILQFGQPFDNHNGGMLEFGPDGYLYIGTGDGGSAGDPQNNAQNRNSLLGKILRIDIDGGSPYAIPPDNPFSGQPGARGEIWAYGLRNPWRFSFDRTAGRLFAGDVGQNRVEEVDLVARGGNYGWRIMEGSICFNPPSDCNQSGLILPIGEYSNPGEGRSITGGYVYRGPQQTSLRGAYIVGDYESRRIWALEENSDGTWRRSQILDSGLSISSFGEDENRELYVVHHGGSIHWMVFGSTQAFPQIADGGGYTTTITITNTTNSSVQGTLRFFNGDGTARTITLVGVGTGSSFAIQVPPGGTRVLATSGSAATVTVGMALLDTVPTAGAVATFRLRSGARLATIAGVLNSGFLTRATVPVNTVEPANTGIAIGNPGDAPVNVRLVLLGREGSITQTLDPVQLNPLPAKAQVALFLTELGFPTGLADSSLQVLVQGPGEVAVVSLVVEEGQLSVLPVLVGAK